MTLIKSISFYIIIGFLISWSSQWLESDFLFKYLKENIVGLLITLLAINTATLGLISSKIQDIVLKEPMLDFKTTIKEMKVSLLEQIFLIGSSIVCLLLMESPKIIFHCKDLVGNTILTTILIYSIAILWDTGKAVFIIIDELQDLHNKS